MSVIPFGKGDVYSAPQFGLKVLSGDTDDFVPRKVEEWRHYNITTLLNSGDLCIIGTWKRMVT